MRPIREAIAAAFAVIALVEPVQGQQERYECIASHAYSLEKDDLVKQPQRNFYTMYKEIFPGATYYFAVDRASGEMSGALSSRGGRATVLDVGRGANSYKVIYASDPGLYVHVRYLIIDYRPSKGFILVDAPNVGTGTCTLVK